MSNESTHTAGEPGSKDKVRQGQATLDPRPLLAAIADLKAEVSALRAEHSQLMTATLAAATAAEEAAAYMRVLLPEQYHSLRPEEVLQLHEVSPSSRLKLTADFVTNMVRMPRGEVIEAGDPRVKLYGHSLQLALVVGGDEAHERVAELAAKANARQVQAVVEQKRLEQVRRANELAARAEEAAAQARKLAQETG